MNHDQGMERHNVLFIVLLYKMTSLCGACSDWIKTCSGMRP